MKRIRFISIILVVVLSISCCVLPASAGALPTEYLVGDMNYDVQLTVSDATTVQQAAAEIVELSEVDHNIADFNHDGFVTVADATFIQQKAAEMDVPQGVGGYLFCDLHIYDFYADYVSGSAAKGTPVTFTAKAYDMYDGITYRFLVNNKVVKERSESNTCTYTFENGGKYTVRVEAFSKYGFMKYESQNYTVLDSVDDSKVRITGSHLRYNYMNYYWDVSAQGGTAPYTYSYVICGEYGRSLDDWDIQQFNYFKSYNDTDWELVYEDNDGFTRAYLKKDYSSDATAVIPEEMLDGGWYFFTVTAKDANGNESEPVIINEGINLAS